MKRGIGVEGSVLDVGRLASIAAMLYRIEGMFAERKSVSGSMSEMESGIFPIFAKLILVGRKRSGVFPGWDESAYGTG